MNFKIVYDPVTISIKNVYNPDKLLPKTEDIVKYAYSVYKTNRKKEFEYDLNNCLIRNDYGESCVKCKNSPHKYRCIDYAIRVAKGFQFPAGYIKLLRKKIANVIGISYKDILIEDEKTQINVIVSKDYPFPEGQNSVEYVESHQQFLKQYAINKFTKEIINKLPVKPTQYCFEVIFTVFVPPLFYETEEHDRKLLEDGYYEINPNYNPCTDDISEEFILKKYSTIRVICVIKYDYIPRLELLEYFPFLYEIDKTKIQISQEP